MQKLLLILSHHQIVCRSLNHQDLELLPEVLEHKSIKYLYHRIVFKCLDRCYHQVVIQIWYITLVSMPNFILSEYFVDNGCLHLLLINFLHRQANYLSESWREALFLYYLEDALTRSLSSLLGPLLVSLDTQPSGPFTSLTHYIIVGNLKVNISPTKSQSYCIQWVA